MNETTALSILKKHGIKLIKEESETDTSVVENDNDFLGSFDKSHCSYIVDCGSLNRVNDLMSDFWGLAKVYEPLDLLGNGNSFAFCVRGARSRSLSIAIRLAHWCDKWIKEHK